MPLRTQASTLRRERCSTVRDRMSLRRTDLIRAPQHSPPTRELCQSTDYGPAPDLRTRTVNKRDTSLPQCLGVSSLSSLSRASPSEPHVVQQAHVPPHLGSEVL